MYCIHKTQTYGNLTIKHIFSVSKQYLTKVICTEKFFNLKFLEYDKLLRLLIRKRGNYYVFKQWEIPGSPGNPAGSFRKRNESQGWTL